VGPFTRTDFVTTFPKSASGRDITDAVFCKPDDECLAEWGGGFNSLGSFDKYLTRKEDERQRTQTQRREAGLDRGAGGGSIRGTGWKLNRLAAESEGQCFNRQ